jgi:glycerate kinase
MKVVIAPDKFKGSLSAREVCLAIERGIHRFDKNVVTCLNPLADGGDGSLEVLQQYLDLKEITITVLDPLQRPIEASYQMSEKTAYIEMSAAAGLVLLKDNELNCMETTTIGMGQMIVDAVEKGAKEIYLFIGGSATNDGGIGMAKALGYRFLDENQNEVAPIGKNLSLIKSIDSAKLLFDWEEIKVKVVCDVTNPFYGKNGAAFIYAAQKGASPSDIIVLDKGLQHLSAVLEKEGYPAVAEMPGAGAAGGVGGGAMAFMNAELVSGIATFLTLTGLEEKLESTDFIITGEGKIDEQTAQGKVIGGLAKLATQYQIPLYAICGASDIDNALDFGIVEIYTVISQSNSLEEAMTLAAEKIEILAYDWIKNLKS